MQFLTYLIWNSWFFFIPNAFHSTPKDTWITSKSLLEIIFLCNIFSGSSCMALQYHGNGDIVIQTPPPWIESAVIPVEYHKLNTYIFLSEYFSILNHTPSAFVLFKLKYNYLPESWKLWGRFGRCRARYVIPRNLLNSGAFRQTLQKNKYLYKYKLSKDSIRSNNIKSKMSKLLLIKNYLCIW